jgi:hypothetical protein
MIADSQMAAENRLLRPFLREGRIVRWPARQQKRRLLLSEVARSFPPGRRIQEKDVDFLLHQFWPDHCQLRRELVELGLLNRKNGVYWRVG